MEQQTYQEILTRMETAFAEQAGFPADGASDIGIRLRVLAGEIFNLQSGMEWLKRQAFPQTASGEYLDMHASQRGLERREATPAAGVLTFNRSTKLNYALTIPAGTICALSGDPTVRFRTTETAQLAASTTSVDVKAVSEQAGAQYNVAAGMITEIIAPPVGIESVTNSSAFGNGTDRESDEELRRRILFAFANQSNGTNLAFYTNFALGYDSVYSANAVARSGENDAVQLYVSGKGEKLDSSLIARIQADINAVKEVNVTVDVQEAEVKLANFASYVKPAAPYRLEEIQSRCQQIVEDYIAQLRIGEPFVVAQVMQRLMNSGLITNYRVYTYTVDSTTRSNQRIGLNNSAVFTELP